MHSSWRSPFGFLSRCRFSILILVVGAKSKVSPVICSCVCFPWVFLSACCGCLQDSFSVVSLSKFVAAAARTEVLFVLYSSFHWVCAAASSFLPICLSRCSIYSLWSIPVPLKVRRICRVHSQFLFLLWVLSPSFRVKLSVCQGFARSHLSLPPSQFSVLVCSCCAKSWLRHPLFLVHRPRQQRFCVQFAVYWEHVDLVVIWFPT
jgi:hypothetical protein